MPLIVKEIVKQEKNLLKKDEAYSFASIREKASSNLKTTQPIIGINKFVQKQSHSASNLQLKTVKTDIEKTEAVKTSAEKNNTTQIDPQISRNIENASREAERLRAEILELKRARQALQKAKDEDLEQGVSLVVDGEKRKVAKTSRYLLDMLTLDDQ